MKCNNKRIIFDIRCMRKGKNGPSRFSYEMLFALMENNNLHEYLVLIHPEWRGEIKFKRGFIPHYTSVSFLSPWDFVFIMYLTIVFKATIYYSTTFITPIFTGTQKRLATVHDLINLTLPEYYEHHNRCHAFVARHYLRLWTWITIRLSDRLITVSKFSKNQIIGYYNIKPEIIEVVYNGISPKMKPNSLSKETQERFQIKKPYLLGLSNFKGYKNNKCLLKAFAELKKRGFEENLVLFGKYPTRLSKKAIDETMGAEFARHVCLIGIVNDDELSEIYSGARAFIFPSLAEGFGIPAIEAMACGTPVIAANAGSLPEICGDAAIYIDPRKYTELSAAIRMVIEKPKLGLLLKRNGLRNIMNYNWKASADKLINVLTQI